jgi:hypothetical protein
LYPTSTVHEAANSSRQRDQTDFPLIRKLELCVELTLPRPQKVTCLTRKDTFVTDKATAWSEDRAARETTSYRGGGAGGNFAA